MSMKDERISVECDGRDNVDDLQTEDILDYSVCSDDLSDCVEAIVNWIGVGKVGRWLACINPHSYAVALKQPKFSAALKSADWLVPDGAGIVFASRMLRGQIRARVTGSDLFLGLQREMDERGGHNVFFLGSTEETLLAMRDRMAVDFPNINVAGSYSPPFKEEYSQCEIEEMSAAINRARPDVLWVGMTAPKQELWLHDNLNQLETVKFAAAIGAVFDFYAGNVKRSHPFFQKIGLEWLPRLLREPRRLWRRMFVSAPIFVWHVVKARFGHRPLNNDN